MAITSVIMVSTTRCILWILQKIIYICYIPLEIVRLFKRKKFCPPITNNILLIPAVVLAEKIRKREISSETIVKAYIDRIREVNSILNAVVEDRFEEALEDAKNVESILDSALTVEEIKSDYPLLGIPITVKGSIGVENLNHSCGVVADRKALADAVIVKKVREAGGIPLVISNTPELCLNWETTNKLIGTTCNPYDTRRTVGGSSGGEAALISSGASVIGLGSDIAGSLRIPMHFCGVWGHKPTPELVSYVGHYPSCKMEDDWKQVFTLGPISRYAVDLPLLLDVISEPHIRKRQKVAPKNLMNLKVYYIKEIKSFLMSKPTIDTIKAVESVVHYFNSTSNRSCEEIHFSLMTYASEMSYSRLLNIDEVENLFKGRGQGAYAELFRYLTCRSKSVATSIFYGILRKWETAIPKKPRIFKKLNELQQNFLDILDDESVFIMPTFTREATHHGDVLKYVFDYGYCSIFNALGFPVTNCPVLLTKSGLPVGIQVVAAPNHDYLALAVAEEIEKAFGGWKHPPTS